jgi:uncharacterized membrane protein (UPF0127 family)
MPFLSKHKGFLIAALAVAVLAGTMFWYADRAQAPRPAVNGEADAEAMPEPEPAAAPRVQIGAVSIPVELARSSEEVQRGLSGRASLPADQGMLFIFAEPGLYSFWMPDMNFPIDIIWINGGKVVGVTADVSNDFDPADPQYYKPPAPAQYVLEVNAGFAARTGIRAGDAVTFAAIPNL